MGGVEWHEHSALEAEIRRRTDVVGIFPDPIGGASAVRSCACRAARRVGSRSSLPDASSSREAGGSAGGLTDTICNGLSNINRVKFFYTTCWDLTDNSDSGAVRDVITSIRSRAIYINTDANDLQFSTVPNIRNEVAQRKREVQRDSDRVEEFVKQRLQVHFAPNSANSPMGVLVFPSAGDIPDSAHQAQLAVINPSFCNQQSTTRIDDLRNLYTSSDSLAPNSTRQYRNNIVILLAKSNNWPNLQDQVITHIAANAIKDNPPAGMSEANLTELRDIIDRSETYIAQEIRTHWSELYLPSVLEQVADGLPLKHVSMPPGTVNRDGQQDVVDHLTTRQQDTASCRSHGFAADLLGKPARFCARLPSRLL